MAAESGDCDAQMVVGMIHATPAFECYDLPLSEYWLKRSLAGGKADAEKLLLRVQQQMSNAQLKPIEGVVPAQSLTAAAAKQRGDDYRRHGLFKAAAHEYEKAFSMEYTQISHLADHLEAIIEAGNYENCLLNSLHEMSVFNSEGTNMLGGKATRSDSQADPSSSRASARSITEAPAPFVASSEAVDSGDRRVSSKSTTAVAAGSTDSPASSGTAMEPPSSGSSPSAAGAGDGSSDTEGSSRPSDRLRHLSRVYDSISRALVEVNSHGAMATDFLDDTFLRTHRVALISRVLREALSGTPLALKAVCLMLRLVAIMVLYPCKL